MSSAQQAPLPGPTRPQWVHKKTPTGKRRVIADGSAATGADGKEAVRLENQRRLLNKALGQLFFAPISEPNLVLDVGLGTGLWSLEFLEQFPMAHVIGLDNDPVLLKRAFEREAAKKLLRRREARGYPSLLGGQLKYVQADAKKRFPFDDGLFDFAFSELPDVFLSEATWPHLLREMKRITKDEGWVEILYAGHFYTVEPSELIQSMLEVQISLCEKIGVAPTGEPAMDRYLQEAGITRFERRTHIVGEKDWQEQKMVMRDIQAIIEGSLPALLEHHIMGEDEFTYFMEHFLAEGRRAGFRMPFYSLYFQPKDQPKAVKSVVQEAPTHKNNTGRRV